MAATNVRSSWSSGNLVFARKASGTAAAVSFGADEAGLDLNLFGDTADVTCIWDSSADSLIVTGGTIDSAAYSVGGTAGADFDGVVTNITVVKGLVTAAS